MTLAIARSALVAIAGLVAIGAGMVVLQRARRVRRQIESLASSMADRRFVFKIDAAAEGTLPSRFNRSANPPPRPATDLPPSMTSHTLADELEALKLPPGPGAIGLTHRRRAMPVGPPAGPPRALAPAAVDTAAAAAPSETEGVQEPLPLAYGPPRASVTGPPAATAPTTGEPAPPAPGTANGPPAGPAPTDSPFPAGGLNWHLAEASASGPVAPVPAAPAEAPSASPAAPEPQPEATAGGEPAGRPSPGDGAPDFATLVREYIRALRWKVD